MGSKSKQGSGVSITIQYMKGVCKCVAKWDAFHQGINAGLRQDVRNWKDKTWKLNNRKKPVYFTKLSSGESIERCQNCI